MTLWVGGGCVVRSRMSDVEDQAAALSGAEEEEEEEDVDEPTLRLQDIGTFTAQGGEITMKMEPVKQKKKKKKKKKDDKKKDDCSCDDKVDCPDLSKDENLPDCDLDTILERYEALFAGKPNGIEELLYWQRCPLAHAEQEVLGFGRSELLKNDIFPKEDTLEKNIDKLITLVSANLVPGLKAEYTGKKDKRGCETIVIVQKHGNKKVQKKEKPKKEKTGETTCGQKVKGCCSFCLTCQPCKACLGTCKGLCTKDPDDLRLLQLACLVPAGHAILQRPISICCGMAVVKAQGKQAIGCEKSSVTFGIGRAFRVHTDVNVSRSYRVGSVRTRLSICFVHLAKNCSCSCVAVKYSACWHLKARTLAVDFLLPSLSYLAFAFSFYLITS
eukprot:COSAG02_NODE_7065_length_3201_cov_2.020954_3_plen_386_part_00